MPARLSLAAVLLATAACTVGAPPGFSSGDSWSFPLVGPLENGALLVPVKVNGKGPFLFQLDPDARATSIDEGIAGALDLYGRMGPRLAAEDGTTQPTRAAEVRSLELGSLTVRNLVVQVHDGGRFHAAGRDVLGVLGRDVLAESLVFAFDRDAGMAYLVTRDAFTAPDDTIKLRYQDVAPRRGLIGTSGGARRVAPVQVNGSSHDLHLDLGAVQSQLWPARWAAAKLTPIPFRTVLVDELGNLRQVDRGAIANQVTAGDASANGVLFVAYADQRVDAEAIDGALGLNFFAGHTVWADWSGRAIYLRARDPYDDKLAVRLARWQSPVLAACREPACVTAALLPSTAPAPSTGADGEGESPPVELEVTRDASAKELIYEVTLEAYGEDRLPLGLPRLVATLPRGATTVRQKVSPMFAGARFRVVDVSPFVRLCRQPGGCVFELAQGR